MCESCVDRIFSSGPAPCPIAGCKRTLRKARFRKQTFEDLAIEREVDIRKRVMAILNNREDEFETKRDWDNFLEQREEIIMDLVLRLNVAKREKELEKHAAAHVEAIKANEALERKEAEEFRQHHQFNQERARLRQDALKHEDEEDRKEKEFEKNDITNRLASGKTSVDDIVRENKARHKPGGPRSKGGKAQEDNVSDSTVPFIKGLKQRKAPEPEKPYDPFMGMYIHRDYFELQVDYPAQRLGKSKKDTRTLAGGYDFSSFYDESLVKAFAGLGCFIEDEVSIKESQTSHEGSPTEVRHSSLGNTDTLKSSDDVF
ncbi:MAG: hypothetical protein Q9227_004137 [Pyrenula ochraceoflavens]